MDKFTRPGSPEPAAPYRVERAFPNLTFTSPLDAVTLPGTQRLVIVQQRGQIVSIPNDETCAAADAFAELKQFNSEVVECYGIAFHPRFSEQRSAFVWINLDLRGKPTRENGTHIVRFDVTRDDPPRLDLASGRTIFTWLGGGHNGGNLRFGPDGMLYISTGDAAPPEPPDIPGTGQDISDVLSSVLRIDVDRTDPGKSYAIPADNPFVATRGARGEVWAYGFRNPWRLTFHPKNGSLWVGDVGWETWEMIYRVQRGGNYGWSITEGSRQDVRPDRPRGPTPILPPVVAHAHDEAASITGGEFYRGQRLPELDGAYIYGDWQLGTFWALDAKDQPRELCRSTLMPVAFGVAPDGEVLICNQGGGGLWRLVRNADAAKPSAFPRKLSETGLFADTASQQPAPGVVPYSINAARWADHATGERWIAVPSIENVSIAKRALGVMPVGRWVVPKDTVFAKTYSLETRRIETQLLHFDGQQWGAYAYRWNDAQTDADLVGLRGSETALDVKDPSAPGGIRRQMWRTFSRAECLRCHSLWTNFTPGFSALQLDRSTTAATGDQLDLFTRAGLALSEPKLADPHAPDASLEIRARSYLHVNCGTCHRFGGGGSVPSFMNIETALVDARLLRTKPAQGDLGLRDARIIAPGDPHGSVLLYRMTTTGRGHMPYLGGRLVDDRGVILLRDWIASMRRDSAPPSSETSALARLKRGNAAALDELLATPSGALGVALAIVDGSLTGDLRQKAIAKGSALANPLQRDLFDRFLTGDQQRHVLGTDFDSAVLLAKKGDAVRGQALFSAICAACHRAGNIGIDFGPDLSRIAAKFDRAALLDHVRDPACARSGRRMVCATVPAPTTSIAFERREELIAKQNPS